MAEIENAWFGQDTNCPDMSTSVSSNSLRLNSFWGLFLIVGASSSFALIIFLSMLLYEHRNFLMVKYFKKIKQGEEGAVSVSNSSRSSFSDHSSPTSNCMPVQASISIDKEGDIILSEYDIHNSDAQNSQEIFSATEIVSPDQEIQRAHTQEGDSN